MITKLTNWKSSFRLVGNLNISGRDGTVFDTAFKIDERSKNNPDYIYSNMNVGIDCGDKYGRVYTRLMGGYNINNPYGFRVHDAKDYKKVTQVSWEQRFDENILNNINLNDTITVALSRDDKGELIYKHFLSEYDAVNYIHSMLVNDNSTAKYNNGLSVEVRGNLEYNTYNGKTTVQQTIKSIRLTDIRPENYNATFNQTVLINKDSIKKDMIDKDKQNILLNTTVLQYVYRQNGIVYKCQMPYNYMFYLDLSHVWGDKNKLNAYLSTIAKARDGKLNQITFKGSYRQYGNVATVDESILPDEVKTLLELGVANKEDIAKQYATADTNIVHEMVLESVTDIITDIYSEEELVPAENNKAVTSNDLLVDADDMKSTTVGNNAQTESSENKQKTEPELDDAAFEALFGDDTLSI